MIFQQDGEEIKFSSFKGDFEREKKRGCGRMPAFRLHRFGDGGIVEVPRCLQACE